MARRRRIGSETSETRGLLLECVERLMLDKGYAAVSYRSVASSANVTPGLVQYYFPKLDDLFIASIRRYTERNIERLTAVLEAHREQPLRVLWKYSWDESTAALTLEYMALGNHRRSIRSEITKVTKQVQRIQLEALENAGTDRTTPYALDLAPPALLFLLTGVPRLLEFYAGFDVTTGREEVVELIERYLDTVEPTGVGRERKRRLPTSRRRSKR